MDEHVSSAGTRYSVHALSVRSMAFFFGGALFLVECRFLLMLPRFPGEGRFLLSIFLRCLGGGLRMEYTKYVFAAFDDMIA